MTIPWEALLALGLALIGFIVWLVRLEGRATTAERVASEAQEKASEAATTRAIEQLEDRITRAIERLGDRVDRIVESRPPVRSGGSP